MYDVPTTVSRWDPADAATYAAIAHGADGKALLDQLLVTLLGSLAKNGSVFDGGCGAGRFIVFVLKHGARFVIGVDNNATMVVTARSAATEAATGGQIVRVEEGDVTNLHACGDLAESSFDVYLSINVGCNLVELEPMVREANRLLKPGARLFLTGPDWLDQLFLRDGHDEAQVRAQCNQLLAETGDPKCLSALGHIFRATILQEGDAYRLANCGEVLESGRQIWRKLAGTGDNTGIVVPNRWHDADEYVAALTACGFVVQVSLSPRFIRPHAGAAEGERSTWNNLVVPNDRLGPMYEIYNPFFLIVAKKARTLP